jgi:TRAP-type C4-dicarboxylate transport system substrate-binding protein
MKTINGEYILFYAKTNDYDEKAVEELKSKGVKIWTLSPQERTRWVMATRKVIVEQTLRDNYY